MVLMIWLLNQHWKGLVSGCLVICPPNSMVSMTDWAGMVRVVARCENLVITTPRGGLQFDVRGSDLVES